MKIKNLKEHCTNGAVDYFTANLEENGEIKMSVTFSKSVNGYYEAYSNDSNLMYPVESVRNQKIDISDWRDEDDIELGMGIKRDN